MTDLGEDAASCLRRGAELGPRCLNAWTPSWLYVPYAPHGGGGFCGTWGSPNLGEEEGWGTRQWSWAPSLSRKPQSSGLVASPSGANLSALTSL